MIKLNKTYLIKLQALNIKGIECLNKNAFDEAMSFFEKALEIDPYSAVVLNNQGIVLTQLKRYSDAQQAYEKAISAKPDYMKSYKNLGLVHYLQLHHADAINAYKYYLSIEPNDAEALQNLGLLYMAEGREEEAIVNFEQVEALLALDSVENMTQLGVGYFYRGKLDRAMACFDQALEMDENFISARYQRGVLNLTQGQVQNAIKDLQDVLSIAPEYPQAKENLEVAYSTARHMKSH